MKTVVYQSYRTANVPSWIELCLRTVRDWAALKGFEYEFVDDRLFEFAPAWYREKVEHQVQPIADLARLELAKDFLNGKFDRTIWVDADVAIFDSDRFVIDVAEEYAFCREVWIEQLRPLTAARRDLKGFRLDGIYCRERVNNAVTVFTRGNSMLDFYIHACKRIVENKRRVSNLDVGTFFLTALQKQFALPLLTNVGLFSPHLMQDLANGGGRMTEIYRQQFGFPIMAANLCASYANKEYEGITVGDDTYLAVLNHLIDTAGAIVNTGDRKDRLLQ